MPIVEVTVMEVPIVEMPIVAYGGWTSAKASHGTAMKTSHRTTVHTHTTTTKPTVEAPATTHLRIGRTTEKE